MPYPSSDILAAAAADLAGSHPLTIVTIPALLHAGRLAPTASRPEFISNFGTREERPVLEAFRLRSDAKSPYLAVWQEAPTFIRADYPGSTLQRLRTQDLLGQALFNIRWNDSHTKRTGTALRRNAGAELLTRNVKLVNKLSLALWLGRDRDMPSLNSFLTWFDAEFPQNGTDLDEFYVTEAPAYAANYLPPNEAAWGVQQPPSNEELIARINPDVNSPLLDIPSTTPLDIVETVGDSSSGLLAVEEAEGLQWTRDYCPYPLRSAEVEGITQRVLERLEEDRIVLPDAEVLVRRCVAALLVGHLILEGPPGTGKTSLARILAGAFNARLLESTATSEWSPFHVVGGLIPSSDRSLKPSYGKVSDAVLKCAIQVRANAQAEDSDSEDAVTIQARRCQAVWLLIDEFNRADIDKAIGSLYTVLSSCDRGNLERSPIDLWFEREGRQQLWVPVRFRIIAAMNDLDTSFVNPISQGLTRRFQFVTVSPPPPPDDMTVMSDETRQALSRAYAWLTATYAGAVTLQPLNGVVTSHGSVILTAQALVNDLRTGDEGVAGWPVGTAQLADIFRMLLLYNATGTEVQQGLDWAVADRLIPQMGQLDEAQLERAQQLLEDADLVVSAQALRHLLNPND